MSLTPRPIATTERKRVGHRDDAQQRPRRGFFVVFVALTRPFSKAASGKPRNGSGRCFTKYSTTRKQKRS